MTKARKGPHDAAPIRVAWFQGVVPHYRVPLFNNLDKGHGVELTVFAGPGNPGVSNADASGDLTARVVPIRNVYGNGRHLPFSYAHGWSRLLRGFDVVVTSESTRDVATWLLLFLRRLFGFKLVICGHIRLTTHDRVVVARLRRLLVGWADGVIAYTEEGSQQALEWGKNAASVIAMGNTIDTERAERARDSVTPEDVDRFKSERGLGNAVFLFIARPTPWKRLDTAIEAVRILNGRGLRTDLLVVGAEGAAQAGVPTTASDRVHFLGVETRDEVLATYFAAADLVLVPGAVGLAVNHAFAQGRPIVTARHAQHGPEMAIAEHGRNAWLVESTDAEAFAEALERLTCAPELLVRLHQGSRTTELPTVGRAATRIATLVQRVGGRVTTEG